MEHENGDPGPASGRGDEPELSVQGDLTGAVVIGNQSLAINAKEGSMVTILPSGQVPKPVRRRQIGSRPRPPRERLVGRARIIGELNSAVMNDSAVQLYGPPGIGKSEILCHAARQLPGGSDGVVFVLADSAEVRDVAQKLFEECYETASYAPTVAELRRHMTGIRITAYVDNADFTSDQLRELMNMVPDAAFVFASSDPSLRGQGTVLEVDGLSTEDGIQLLERAARQPITGARRAAAADLCRKAQGNPGLLLQAAMLIRSGASGEAVIPRPTAVPEITELMLDELSGTPRDILRLFVTLDGTSIAASHVGKLIGIEDAGRAAELLVAAGLLRADHDMYRCPPEVLRPFRNKNPEPFPADRLCRHFASWASSHEATPDQVARHASAIARVTRLAEETGQPELAVGAARAAVPGAQRALRFGPWGLVLGRGWSAAKAAGDVKAQAYFIREAGVRAALMGQVISAALIEVAIAQLRDAGTASHAGLPSAATRASVMGHMAKLADSPAWPRLTQSPTPPPVPFQAPARLQSPPPPPPPRQPPQPGPSPSTGRPTISPGPGSSPPRGGNPAGAMLGKIAIAALALGIGAVILQSNSSPSSNDSAPTSYPSTSSSGSGSSSTGSSSSDSSGSTSTGSGYSNSSGSSYSGSGSSSSGYSNSSNTGSGYSGSGSSGSGSQATGLAGSWQDSSGNGITILDDGNGTYSYRTMIAGTNCGFTTTLTGSGDTYSGQQEAVDSSCTSYGYLPVTFTLESGGQYLSQEYSYTQISDGNGGTFACTGCQNTTYSRVSG